MTTTDEFTFTALQAARACGVDKKTILRRADRLLQAGATRDGRNWRITPQQLFAVGLHPGQPLDHDPLAAVETVIAEMEAHDEARPQSMSPKLTVPVAEFNALQSQLYVEKARTAELEGQLAEVIEDRNHWRTQHAVAQAVADERMTTAEVLRRLGDLQPRSWWRRPPRQITAGPTSMKVPPTE